MIAKGVKNLRIKGIFHTIQRGFDVIIRPRIGYIAAPFVIRKFQLLSKNITSIKQAINFAFSFQYCLQSIRPAQVKSEISKLLYLLNDNKPKIIVEIGTLNGGTLFLFTRVADSNALIISIDIPGGKFGGGYPPWRNQLYKSFEKDNQRLILLRADSQSITTLNNVSKIIKNRKVDFLFIDGDHRYNSVKNDFEMYSTLMSDKGVIAFHDIAKGPIRPYETKSEVDVLWNEIKCCYHNVEFIDTRKLWAGIGVIFVNEKKQAHD